MESVRSAVEGLKKNKINKIIAVGHAGIDMDKKVANEVDGIDIVVGEHTNTFLYTGKGFLICRLTSREKIHIYMTVEDFAIKREQYPYCCCTSDEQTNKQVI